MDIAPEVDNLDGLDESIAGLYVKQDSGKFRLPLTNFDFADELRANSDKILTEKKELQKKLDGFSKAAEQAAKDKEDASKRTLLEKGEYKVLFDDLTEKYESEKAANTEFKESIQRKDINSSAMRLAIKHASDAGRAEVLSEKIAAMSRHGESGIAFELAGMTVDDKKVISHLSERFPFLIDGNKANGGGADGSKDKSGGAAKTMSRIDFDALDAPAQMKFIKSGGKPID